MQFLLKIVSIDAADQYFRAGFKRTAVRIADKFERKRRYAARHRIVRPRKAGMPCGIAFGGTCKRGIPVSAY